MKTLYSIPVNLVNNSLIPIGASPQYSIPTKYDGKSGTHSLFSFKVKQESSSKVLIIILDSENKTSNKSLVIYFIIKI